MLCLEVKLFVSGKALTDVTTCKSISACDIHAVQTVAIAGRGSMAGWLIPQFRAPPCPFSVFPKVYRHYSKKWVLLYLAAMEHVQKGYCSPFPGD